MSQSLRWESLGEGLDSASTEQRPIAICYREAKAHTVPRKERRVMLNFECDIP